MFGFFGMVVTLLEAALGALLVVWGVFFFAMWFPSLGFSAVGPFIERARLKDRTSIHLEQLTWSGVATVEND
jgi:hypothetical protein